MKYVVGMSLVLGLATSAFASSELKTCEFIKEHLAEKFAGLQFTTGKC